MQNQKPVYESFGVVNRFYFFGDYDPLSEAALTGKSK